MPTGPEEEMHATIQISFSIVVKKNPSFLVFILLPVLSDDMWAEMQFVNLSHPTFLEFFIRQLFSNKSYFVLLWGRWKKGKGLGR